MPTMFNPNQGLPDFEAQTQELARAKAYADMLRKQSVGTPQPQGQMVSGHYVAPHWTQYLGGMMDKINAGWQDKNVANQERSLNDAQTQAADAWRSSLPQSVAAQPGTPSFGANEMDQESVVGTPATPYQPVPVAARLKATLAGMNNPKTAREAVLWNQGVAEETAREDTQQARREAQAAQLQQRVEELRQKSEDTRFSQQQQLAAQERLQQLMMQNRLDVANIGRAAGGGAQAERDLRREERREDKLDKQVTALSTAAKTVAPMIQTAKTVQEMLDTYDTKPIPGVGYMGQLPGFMLSKEGVINRAKIKGFANAMLRNQAGLSQTLSETENANLELLANGNFSEAEFRKIWPTLMDKINATTTTMTAGYLPEAVNTVRKRGGVIDPVTSRLNKGGASGSFGDKLTPAEAAELAALRARFPGAVK